MQNRIRIAALGLAAGVIAGCASKKEVHVYGEDRVVPVAHETHYDYDYQDGREVEVERRVYRHDHEHVEPIEDVEIHYDR